MKPLVAICVGHSRIANGRTEGGAISISGECEWSYNRQLAEMIADELGHRAIDTVEVTRYEGEGYGAAQRWLAARLEAYGATLAIELHFNSSDNPESNGHEWLYWNTSRKGKLLADNLNSEMCLGVNEIRTRGIIPKFKGDRGAEFLRGVRCPSVICEVGFGSSAKDWKVMTEKKDAIARAIAHGILEYLD